jgi:hypothetical protein
MQENLKLYVIVLKYLYSKLNYFNLDYEAEMRNFKSLKGKEKIFYFCSWKSNFINRISLSFM